MSPPTLLFGAGFLGVDFATPTALQDLLTCLRKNDISRIDTARRYPAVNSGRSEQLLGEVDAAGQSFTIDTKIKMVGSDPKGSLTAAKIKESVLESLEALRVDEVNVLYCHMPDLQTPIEESAKAFDDVYKEGKFKKLGLANYTAPQIEEWMRICDEKGYIRPSVYQGQYNLLCRGCEDDIFPLVRKFGMAFNAYSPLASGFLTGKLTAGTTAGTRFEPGNAMTGGRSPYDRPVMHDAVRKIQAFIAPLGQARAESVEGVEPLALAEVALRWLVCHSKLREGDGVILGGSRTAQIERNKGVVGKGKLDEGLVECVEGVWVGVRREG